MIDTYARDARSRGGISAWIPIALATASAAIIFGLLYLAELLPSHLLEDIPVFEDAWSFLLLPMVFTPLLGVVIGAIQLIRGPRRILSTIGLVLNVFLVWLIGCF